MRLTQREFHRLVDRAFRDLPPNVAASLENLAILIEDSPSGDDLESAGLEGRDQLFGLYTGIPLPEREGGPPPLPDTITIFQRAIESACTSRRQVIEEIRVTLLHEVGHYLGMSEEDLEGLGYG